MVRHFRGLQAAGGSIGTNDDGRVAPSSEILFLLKNSPMPVPLSRLVRQHGRGRHEAASDDLRHFPLPACSMATASQPIFCRRFCRLALSRVFGAKSQVSRYLLGSLGWKGENLATKPRYLDAEGLGQSLSKPVEPVDPQPIVETFGPSSMCACEVKE